MYKDKALQKETTLNRVRRYRTNQKALQGVTIEEGVTPEVRQGSTDVLLDLPNLSEALQVLEKIPSMGSTKVGQPTSVRPYSKEEQLG